MRFDEYLGMEFEEVNGEPGSRIAIEPHHSNPTASPRAGRAAEASPRAGLELTARRRLGQKGP